MHRPQQHPGSHSTDIRFQGPEGKQHTPFRQLEERSIRTYQSSDGDSVLCETHNGTLIIRASNSFKWTWNINILQSHKIISRTNEQDSFETV